MLSVICSKDFSFKNDVNSIFLKCIFDKFFFGFSNNKSLTTILVNSISCIKSLANYLSSFILIYLTRSCIIVKVNGLKFCLGNILSEHKKKIHIGICYRSNVFGKLPTCAKYNRLNKWVNDGN